LQVNKDKKDRPLEDIEIIQTNVFSDPLAEADELLREFITRNTMNRKNRTTATSLPQNVSSATDMELPPPKFQKLN
jgi:hypothetical protein